MGGASEEHKDEYGVESTSTEILQEVATDHDLLPPSPKSLFSLLTVLDSDLDPVPDDEDGGEPLHEAENAAFTKLTAAVNKSY